MAILPTEIPVGTVKGQFYYVSEDSVDTDTKPDLQVVTGTVEFKATVKVFKIPSKTSTILPKTFVAKFDSNGNITPVGTGNAGIELVATNSPLINDGLHFQWSVIFNLTDANTGYFIPIPQFNIDVPVGATVDLSTIMPTY